MTLKGKWQRARHINGGELVWLRAEKPYDCGWLNSDGTSGGIRKVFCTNVIDPDPRVHPNYWAVEPKEIELLAEFADCVPLITQDEFWAAQGLGK